MGPYRPNSSDLDQPTPHSDLSDALERSQCDIEQEKAALAHILHDDLGALLVGAIMDIGWISEQEGHSNLVREKLARAASLLRAAVDLKREIIENLRPTLLENVGLYSALRWHLKRNCDAAGVAHCENIPFSEVDFSADLKIGVFRILQEALKHVLSREAARELSLDVEVLDGRLRCHLEGTHFVEHGQAGDSPILEIAMRQRAQSLGGTLQWLQNDRIDCMDLQIPFTLC
jgi:signal transduction histidine kinase